MEDPLAEFYGERYQRIIGSFFQIHPDAKIGKNVRIGEGVIIEDDCVIGDNVFLGHYVILRTNTHVGNGTKLMNFTTCEEGVRVGNRVSIGVYGHLTKDVIVEDKVFAAGYLVTLNTNRISHERKYNPIFKPPIIKYGARLGARVCVMPGVTIGREALIAACSVITKDCKPYGIYMGHPAKYINQVPMDERL